LTPSYRVTSLSDLLSLYTQEHVSEAFSTFSCERDKDVESFLKEKEIVQEKKHISRTYLIFTTNEEPELAAYFTVAVKSMDVTDLECNSALKKKMNIHDGLRRRI
jgi:hypothetical protein